MVKDHSDSDSGNHIGYSFRLAARVLLYASSYRQDNKYQGLCYTSRGALAGTRNWVGRNNYKRTKPPEHAISFKNVVHVASVHFVRKYLS